ncbi:MAG: lamin tail domain-containing protein [Candidatus Hydrogenedens sp.]|nr:lamin tail domain-containing protein [Candidatus Hydrogenedens sp.]
MTERQRNRGAALIIAVAIMAVLLAIGLTFFTVTRIESDTAASVVHNVRAEYLVDAGFAIAQHTLNKDLQYNPRGTSTDHGWRTLFNGAAYVGKQWAWVDGVPPWEGGTVAFSLEPVERALRDAGLLRILSGDTGGLLYAQFKDDAGNPDGPREPLFRGPRTAPWLHVPRWQGTDILLYASTNEMDLVSADGTRITDAAANAALGGAYRFVRFVADASGNFPRGYPFVTPDFYGVVGNPDDPSERPLGLDTLYPAEWVNKWADFDSTGDGLRDSLWLPLPKDIDLSQDGIDNDLDGVVDPTISSEDPLVAADESGELRRLFELGAFVYGVAADGSVVRNRAQDGVPVAYKLTLPLPGLAVPVDLDGDGLITPADNADDGRPVYLSVAASLNVPGVPVPLTIADLDSLDNDYDLTVNGVNAYAGWRLNGGEDQVSRQGLRPVNLAAVADGSRMSTNNTFTFRGEEVTLTVSNVVLGVAPEPVCEIVGRMAVRVSDESAKVNLNAAGAHVYGSDWAMGLDDTTEDNSNRSSRTVRALGRGATPFEYETRMLPAFGPQRAAEAWNMLMGAGVKVPSPSNPNLWDFTALNPDYTSRNALPPYLRPYFFDISLPGYGRVDDNVNSLLLAFSGRDDNASGLADSGLYLPPVSALSRRVLAGLSPSSLSEAQQTFVQTELGAGRLFNRYYHHLGLLEGIDEPAEYQRRAPARNRLAEADVIAPGLPGIPAGDNNLDGTANEAGELGDRALSVHYELQKMADAGGARAFGDARWPDIAPVVTANSDSRNVTYVSTPYGDRAINKLDPNLATPAQLAAFMMIKGDVPPVTAVPDAVSLLFGSTELAFAEGLRQAQHSVNGRIFDNAAGTFPFDPQLQAMQVAVNIADSRDHDPARSLLVMEKRPTGDYAPLQPAEPLNERERVPRTELFPTGQIQEYLAGALGLTTENKRVVNTDPWWREVTADAGAPQDRLLSYAVAGADAIRITELMVRPVRRVEAECIPLDDQIANQIPYPYVPSAVAGWPSNSFNLNPAPYPGMPVFDVVSAINTARATGSNISVAGTFPGAPLLGENTWISMAAPDADPEVGTWNNPEQERLNTDILEFNFRATDGLPNGRYYLTAKIQAVDPDTLQFINIRPDQIEYTVKYKRDLSNGSMPAETVAAALLAGRTQDEIDRIGATLNTSILEDFQSIYDPSNPDVEDLNNRFFNKYWRTIAEQDFISDTPGAAPGWVFFPNDPPEEYDRNVDSPSYWLDGVRLDATDAPPATSPDAQTFTVMVPTLSDPTIEPLGSLYDTLCVAFRIKPSPENQGRVLAINFFDFSQEPDHEYVEITNTTDKALDLSGWTLEVGIPDPAGVDEDPQMRDPFKSKWRVPDGTSIAANGNLLLAFTDQNPAAPLEKTTVDRYRTATSSGLNANGIGMGALAVSPTELVSVPPVADASVNPLYGDLADPTGSVFRRLANDDYVDNDGDGVSSVSRVPGQAFDTDNLLSEIQAHGNDAGVVPAFSRIVPLQNERLWDDPPYTGSAVNIEGINSVERIAQVVLRGGFLPNYPEHDGYDNDGDGGYLALDGTGMYFDENSLPIRRYVRGTLDKDMVDNNLNARVDENGTEYLIAANTYAHGSPFLSEGVDEGRINISYTGLKPRIYGSGSFEAGEMGILFYPEVGPYNIWLATLEQLLNRQGVNDGVNFAALEGGPLPGLSVNDSPDWKAFVERRWNPGDNVIVTLYVGPSEARRVADQVTYREYDVINRTIDDIVESPYTLDGYNNYVIDPLGSGQIVWGGALGTNPALPANRVCLDAVRPSLWLPNHMGLDFYRSLERKHPLYAGDRFGTSNRWEPTDGAYDDWAESLSFFESVEDRTGSSWASSIEPRFGPDSDGITPKDNAARLFGHAMAGSPLRMNTQQRLWDNPRDLVAALVDDGGYTPPEDMVSLLQLDGRRLRQFVESDQVAVGVADTALPETYANFAHTFRRAAVRGENYGNLGDLMGVSMPVFAQDLRARTATGYVQRVASAAVNTRMRTIPGRLSPPIGTGGSNYPLWRQDLSLRGAVLANLPDTSQDGAGLAGVTDLSALNPVVLTVGQADFTPLWPHPVDVDADYARWDTATGAAPHLWTPVYLFNDGPGYATAPYPPFGRRGTAGGGGVAWESPGASFGEAFEWPVLLNADFLFDTGRRMPVFGWLTLPEVAERWPVARRAVMYVSKHNNMLGESARAEAVFSWDANDGLENGTYVAYVGTFIPGLAERLGRAQETTLALAERSGALPAGYDLDKPDAPIMPVDTDGNLDPLLSLLLGYDAARDRRSGDRLEPVLALEFVTDRTRASRVAPPRSQFDGLNAAARREAEAALPHPEDWQPGDATPGAVSAAQAYRPDGDGMIFYSHDAGIAWRPRLVRVTDNFLALRVRNLGRTDQVGCVTCVVLAPAPGVAGRINVNTAETTRVVEGASQYLFNPLLGLPGVVAALSTQAVAPGPAYAPNEAVGPPLSPQTAAWAPPYLFDPAGTSRAVPPAGPRVDGGDPNPNQLGRAVEADRSFAALRLMSMLVAERPEHADGRYYTSLADLARGAGKGGTLSSGRYPLSNESVPELRYEEIAERFSRMSNLLATRSDVFEILVTVQAGSAVDLDGDGRADYRGRRNAEEFVVTAESRGRVVYERRARRDKSDEAVGR